MECPGYGSWNIIMSTVNLKEVHTQWSHHKSIIHLWDHLGTSPTWYPELVLSPPTITFEHTQRCHEFYERAPDGFYEDPRFQFNQFLG